MRDINIQQELDMIKEQRFAKMTDKQLIALDKLIAYSKSDAVNEVNEKTARRIWDTPENRFWKITDKKDDHECWECKSYRISTGRKLKNGRIQYKSIQRFSLELHGNFSKKPCVVARCSNSKCVNPNHLFYATKKEAARIGGSLTTKIFTKKEANKDRNLKIVSVYKKLVKANGGSSYGVLTKLTKMFGVGKPTLSTIIKKYS
jgi:hypothetical protein